MSVAALVLAGRRGGADPLLDAHPGLASKALLPVAGAPMIARVLDALDGVADPVWVSGLSAAEAGRAVTEAPRAGGPTGAVAAAMEAGVPLPLLVTTADHALLDAAMIREFLDAARATGADLCVGFAERGVIEARFPETRRTYLRFRDAQVSGCNLFYVEGPAALPAIRFWRRAEADRKTPWKLARHVGVRTLLAYAAGRLTLAGVFAHASARTGAAIAPVLMSRAEAAVDVDKPADLALVEAILAGRA